MSKTTKIVLGLLGGVLVAGGVVYVVGRRQLAVQNAAVADGGTEQPEGKPAADAVLKAGWAYFMGPSSHQTGILTAPPGDPTASQNTGTADALGEPIIGNRDSAVTTSQLAAAGVFR